MTNNLVPHRALPRSQVVWSALLVILFGCWPWHASANQVTNQGSNQVTYDVTSEGIVAQNRPAQTLCRPTVAWHIAEVDSRFNLTPREVARAAEQATAMWNQAVQGSLFEHVEQGGIAVSLEYDHRQAFFEQANLIYQQLEELRQLIADSDNKLGDYLGEVNVLAEQIDSYNAQIRMLSGQANQLIEANSDRRGRVPATIAREVNALRSEITELNESVQRLVAEHNRIQQAYNNHVAERNLLAQQHSELASRLNQKIASQRGATDVGEHGILLRSSGTHVSVAQELISVYQVRSWQGLVTVLAHEFGHAIGIGHVTDTDSIMAARIESQLAGGFPEQLSAADIAALRLVCASAGKRR